MREIEQPREPVFYPNEKVRFLFENSKTEKTLQSIDDTLKRIEVSLLELKSLFSASDGSALSEQR